MTELVIVLAFVSLAVELVAFPVPSVASTPTMMRKRERPLWTRLLVFAAPTGLSILCFLLPLAMVLTPELRRFLGPITLLEHPAVAAAGIALIVSGRVLTFASVLTMRGREARLFRPAQLTELRRHRLFEKSRNPGLVGMFAFYLGLVLVFPCLALVLGIPLYFGNMHLRVLVEESDLSARFGPSYLAYFEGTRRYL